MQRILLVALTTLSCALLALAAEPPAVTVYNQNFGVVREHVPLKLQAGVNEMRFTEITAHVEPDSVVLRDPSGKHALRILEQNYRADPVSQALLLSLFEGQTIDFQVADPNDAAHPQIVSGKIIRSGYAPHTNAWAQYGYAYSMRQSATAYDPGGGSEPIIELNGKIRFGLPGLPVFPSLADDTILKPTLQWTLESDQPGEFVAELSYVTGGMSWKADYNVVAPAQGDLFDLVGWVTIDNQSGRDFPAARLKLMAGDVSKIQTGRELWLYNVNARPMSGAGGVPPVIEKAFDEYHLYTLARPTTLRDRETKQVEFVRTAEVKSQRVYVYDGAFIDSQRYQGWDPASLRVQSEYGTQCNPKVWVMREFENRADNGLGMPLPAGRVRFYRHDDDGQLEFTGENEIGHTPKDERVRIYTGNAFDLVGERTRTKFQVSNDQDWLDEGFEIVVRNHKDEPAAVRIVEHLYRWTNWELREKSQDFTKKDAQTIEFGVDVPANGEAKVTYLVHYSW